MSFVVETVKTAPIDGQKTGTSGLRKKVVEFQKPHYLANWIQALYRSFSDPSSLHGSTIVLGGDGRYWVQEAAHIILELSAANKVAKVVVGQNGILSTPAISAIIRSRKLFGGIILTASHNPGGPTEDFGIKFNTSNGGPAPESITDAIFKNTATIQDYLTAKFSQEVDFSKLGVTQFKEETTGRVFEVEVIDSVAEYADMLKSVFDFKLIQELIQRPDFKFLFDSMHGVTGVYTKGIFIDIMKAPADSIMNAVPLQDFGGHHPDPNLTYAPDLVKRMSDPTSNLFLGAASDGDGDRNMILGNSFFVNPSDSVAVIAANSRLIKYFEEKGVKALARSMPTSGALDRVAEKLGAKFFEVPTGWKFFGNIMDAFEAKGEPRSVICGEESFGTGSDHIREKDGIWAVLCWLSILAHKNKDVPVGGKLISPKDVLEVHWKEFGRNYYSRYDYEGVETKEADEMMAHLTSSMSGLAGQSFLDGAFVIKTVDNFQYDDEFDKSVTTNQGIRIIGQDGSRVIFRLSGTGSSGATIRIYFEKYESDESKLQFDPQVALKGLIDFGLSISKLTEFTGRSSPTVIT
eukprot:TRINITY_DN4523_c0_g1_i1.p1 TRINITY_DN4523_c0_g1~~TRINITY_DN4523_c0_g1_i1.p1  ORF type:complete len:576 (+),score=223.36 TRINITY_DN4523_c0_g1_i1:184-1911(+)